MFILCHMINDGSEVGGSIQLNRLKALVVSFKNPLDTVTIWVLNVAVLKETKQVHHGSKNISIKGTKKVNI